MVNLMMRHRNKAITVPYLFQGVVSWNEGHGLFSGAVTVGPSPYYTVVQCENFRILLFFAVSLKNKQHAIAKCVR